ncbi:MAG: Fe-S cluster assembly protein SufD, partial [Flavisolibacter sp.]
MNTIEHIKDQFLQIHPSVKAETLSAIEQNAFDAFNRMGIPTVRHEEWKYTRINSVFNISFEFKKQNTLSSSDLDSLRLPGNENANE